MEAANAAASVALAKTFDEIMVKLLGVLVKKIAGLYRSREPSCHVAMRASAADAAGRRTRRVSNCHTAARGVLASAQTQGCDVMHPPSLAAAPGAQGTPR